MLNKSSKSRSLALFQTLGVKFSFFLQYVWWYLCFKDVLSNLWNSFLPSLLRDFIINGYWTLSNVFLYYLIWSFDFSLLMCWITLIFFFNVESALHLAVVFIFTYCWIQFANICWILLRLCSWGYLSVIFFFVLSLSNFGIVLILVS